VKPSDEIRTLPMYRTDPMFRRIVDTYADLDRASALLPEQHYLFVGYLLGLIAKLLTINRG
jgi:hypothetical protein